MCPDCGAIEDAACTCGAKEYWDSVHGHDTVRLELAILAGILGAAVLAIAWAVWRLYGGS